LFYFIQTNRLFSKANIVESQWYLYQILVWTNVDTVETQLGFLVPSELIEVKLNLYGENN